MLEHLAEPVDLLESPAAAPGGASQLTPKRLGRRRAPVLAPAGGSPPPREPHSHFSPWREPRPCWFCSSFAGLAYGGSAAMCRRGALSVQANPGYGCAFFEREPGVDDEPDWRPAGATLP